MAYDGIVVHAILAELKNKILGGKLAKISQPEPDQILLTIKNGGENHRLLLSASAALPFVCLTQENYPAPATAPAFCMMLRKHIANGRITDIRQYGLERILILEIEHLNEMGDLCRKLLITEIMGKHSNIIFCDDEETILDSIKRISAGTSSVREVLPGRKWFLPEEIKKADPLTASEADIADKLRGLPQPLFKAVYTVFSGISPLSANELCHRAGLADNVSCAALSDAELSRFSSVFSSVMRDVAAGSFDICVYEDGERPMDFSAIDLSMYPSQAVKHCSSISDVCMGFFEARSRYNAISSKSSDLRKLISRLIARTANKIELLEKQKRDTEDREKFKLRGELLMAYGYGIEPGAKTATLVDYYTDKEITFPLDPELSAIDNAKKYYDKYTKARRMYEMSEEQLGIATSELEHLQSIEAELLIARDENDLSFIRQEMQEFGYIKKSAAKGAKKLKQAPPYHYVTEDGYDIYVGRNNYQNDELTFKFADGGDMWFHAKNMPGSHVIVKAGGRELPDHVYEAAGSLAAFYSKGREADKVEIDYIQRKHVKRTPGGAPGFVIYHTNYSLMARPDISSLREVK